MARKSFVELQAEVAASFPDNTTGAITPAILRAFLVNFLNAIRPAYGYIERGVTPVVQSLTTVNQPLQFETGFVSDVPDYSTSPATGVVTRLLAGTTSFNFTADFECLAGRKVTATLFKNGVATVWAQSGSGNGNGNPVSISFGALLYDGGSATYQIQVRADTNTTVTFYNLNLLAETIPVNAY